MWVKADGAYGWQLWHLLVPIVWKFWRPQRPGILGACPGLCDVYRILRVSLIDIYGRKNGITNGSADRIGYYVLYSKQYFARSNSSGDKRANLIFRIMEANKMHISQLYFDKQLYMFRTDRLPIIRSLDIVFTAIGICLTGMLTAC